MQIENKRNKYLSLFFYIIFFLEINEIFLTHTNCSIFYLFKKKDEILLTDTKSCIETGIPGSTKGGSSFMAFPLPSGDLGQTSEVFLIDNK